MRNILSESSASSVTQIYIDKIRPVQYVYWPIEGVWYKALLPGHKSMDANYSVTTRQLWNKTLQ